MLPGRCSCLLAFHLRNERAQCSQGRCRAPEDRGSPADPGVCEPSASGLDIDAQGCGKDTRAERCHCGGAVRLATLAAP